MEKESNQECDLMKYTVTNTTLKASHIWPGATDFLPSYSDDLATPLGVS